MEQGIKEAVLASKMSYSPYSKFRVGAAVELKNGNFIRGCNVENMSYGLTICAERCALFKAYSDGFNKKDIKAIYIYGETDEPISPCGACRQVIWELMENNAKVVLISKELKTKVMEVTDLLPYPFAESSLLNE